MITRKSWSQSFKYPLWHYLKVLISYPGWLLHVYDSSVVSKVMLRDLVFEIWVSKEKYIDGSKVSHKLDNTYIGINVLNEVKEITSNYKFLQRERELKRILKEC